MTLVKFNQHPARNLGSFVNDIFNDRFLAREFGASDFFGNRAPVNIVETKDGYALEVVAPGFEKADFKINLEGHTLTISAEKKTEQKDESEKHIRREFSFRSFSRSFTLDETVDAENINAKYENGVLKLILPKKEEKKDTVKDITVA